MKRMIATLAAAALTLPVAAQARDYRPNNHGQQVSHWAKSRGHDRSKDVNQYHQFKKGERFDQNRARNYRQISYRDYRGLRAPPSGYKWVRNGDDALMIGITSGIVSAVVSNLFR